jgi:hypothetical protein
MKMLMASALDHPELAEGQAQQRLEDRADRRSDRFLELGGVVARHRGFAPRDFHYLDR